MVEGARLESVCRGDPPTEGSNPSLSATKSCRCSHFGIARGLPPISSLDSGDVSGHGRGAGEVSRCLGRGGGRCPRDRLASQVRWSGVLREPCTTDPCQSSGPRSVGFQDGSRQVPEYAVSRTSRGTAAEPTSQKLTMTRGARGPAPAGATWRPGAGLGVSRCDRESRIPGSSQDYPGLSRIKTWVMPSSPW